MFIARSYLERPSSVGAACFLLLVRLALDAPQNPVKIPLATPRGERHLPPLAKNGVLAQLVERLNGIEEVRGSNPLGSTSAGHSAAEISNDDSKVTRIGCWIFQSPSADRRPPPKTLQPQQQRHPTQQRHRC